LIRIRTQKLVIFNELIGVFDLNYLPALVHTGLGVDAVRLFGLTRIFISVKLRCFQGIMSAALARPRM